ncbi:Bch2p NDAI_0B05070 [Naumovozyma dairenensis CBS 421]|uniref:Uncharacterized protein n=1 Tax=Naumovozyma dairenensis (strain ATCC 10597 / BCRC 20456 / CBS 421 / NBRC 0211 / NRRL Y-12639) TaxID=1071378 RepID=G0W6X9_NAUDC|nr:hypothetical protein NDAI_0B05070 [Naumovozyma dairenensis CBS 421]CCD23540.1 hypothetical protein NDAI_0B05070 [Naumovozyma dairenensis CBS 421]
MNFFKFKGLTSNDNDNNSNKSTITQAINPEAATTTTTTIGRSNEHVIIPSETDLSTKIFQLKNLNSDGKKSYTGTPNSDTKISRSIEFNNYLRVIERTFNSSLKSRAKLIYELILNDSVDIGPPDLIHMTTHDDYHNLNIGEYFHITGIDCSNELMPLSFLKLLNSSSLSSSSSTSNSATASSHIKHNTNDDISSYSCFNIFSKVDLRLNYKSESIYQINLIKYHEKITSLGNKKIEEQILQLNDEIWLECFVSNIIRSLIINNDKERQIPILIQYPVFQKNNENFLVETLCQFIPRFSECGWDSTKSAFPTIIHNYLTEALLIYLKLNPKLINHTLNHLKKLSDIMDPHNATYYKIISIAIMNQNGQMELQLINSIHNLLETLFHKLYSQSNKQSHSHISVQLINCITILLNYQTNFLLKKKDITTALQIAKYCTNLSSDSFYSWYNLANCYIHMKQYDLALIAINSLPFLPPTNIKKQLQSFQPSTYFKRPNSPTDDKDNLRFNLTPIQFNNITRSLKNLNLSEMQLKSLIFNRSIYTPQQSKLGEISKIWNKDCLDIGPIYGPDSNNLIDFISSNEFNSIKNTNNASLLLKRSMETRQSSFIYEKISHLLIKIINEIGWNELLQIRGRTFVMEREYNDNAPNREKEFKNKRVCQRWLDQIFMDLYEDLKISQEEVDNNTKRKYTPLEWQLLGLTMFRVWYLEQGISCLRTSLLKRTDPISCEKILQLYLERDYEMDSQSSSSSLLNEELLVELVVKKISYEARFYDTLQIFNMNVLFKLCEEFGIDAIRGRIITLPFIEEGILTLTDTMLNWIQESESTVTTNSLESKKVTI